jgi:Fe-Mn family superoxide dismutase
MPIRSTKDLSHRNEKEEKMAYTAKDYSRLLGMQGFSETLLKNHFTLYQGYVTNTNKLMDTLSQMLKEGKTATLSLPN